MVDHSVPVRNRHWLAAAALIMAMALSGCGRAPAPEAQPLRVAIDLWPGYYPLVIAEARGYLAEEHVVVDLKIPQDTHRMIAEFAAHQHDLICVSLGDIVLATRVQPDIRMILCSDESAGGDQLLVCGAAEGDAVVRGKRIGTTMGGFGEVFVRRFLQSRGVRPDEVILINTDAALVPKMLQEGALDIGHTWEPYASEARARGCRAVYTSRETPGLIMDGLVTHAVVVAEREAELHGLVRAWLRAVDWWRANEAEGNALVEARLKQPAGSVSLTGIRLLGREENRHAFDPTTGEGSLRLATGEFVEFFISRGMLGRRVPAEELLEPRFVE